MAWKEQCKIAFKTCADRMIAKQGRRHGAITQVIQHLSQESDIPYQTLKNWYYEKSTENGTNRQVANNNNNQLENNPPQPSMIIQDEKNRPDGPPAICTQEKCKVLVRSCGLKHRQSNKFIRKIDENE